MSSQPQRFSCSAIRPRKPKIQGLTLYAISKLDCKGGRDPPRGLYTRSNWRTLPSFPYLQTYSSCASSNKNVTSLACSRDWNSLRQELDLAGCDNSQTAVAKRPSNIQLFVSSNRRGAERANQFERGETSTAYSSLRREGKTAYL